MRSAIFVLYEAIFHEFRNGFEMNVRFSNKMVKITCISLRYDVECNHSRIEQWMVDAFE
jgi:hypothetical protein